MLLLYDLVQIDPLMLRGIQCFFWLPEEPAESNALDDVPAEEQKASDHSAVIMGDLVVEQIGCNGNNQEQKDHSVQPIIPIFSKIVGPLREETYQPASRKPYRSSATSKAMSISTISTAKWFSRKRKTTSTIEVTIWATLNQK